MVWRSVAGLFSGSEQPENAIRDHGVSEGTSIAALGPALFSS